ncbi:hypothetical protein TNIN_30111 [Trichonephila inaurata madagascariensis]|uniref:Uncharacterized protein n=1 Tax=Trichonephila inaurata madagascariensis TaxID=2747483 RepID=A0A8X7CER0_9ARAC|nr:hypothetical protein TNIN_30111 [Trichonephila inaurata madagascariensis]
MDDLDVALVMYLEDEQSSEEESRSEESELFKNRSSEGVFQILVCRHLHCNDEKFRQYFRLTAVLFDYVLNNIPDELTSKPYNRHKKPICPEEKLCILVRRNRFHIRQDYTKDDNRRWSRTVEDLYNSDATQISRILNDSADSQINASPKTNRSNINLRLQVLIETLSEQSNPVVRKSLRNIVKPIGYRDN